MAKKNLTEAVNPVTSSKLYMANPKTYLGIGLFGVGMGVTAWVGKKVYDGVTKTYSQAKSSSGDGVSIIGSL